MGHVQIAVVSILLLLTSACSDTCELPARTTYSVHSCDPLEEGMAGCVGGPVFTVDGDTRQDDIDIVFPSDCGATIPDCNGSEPRTFICIGSSWSELR